LSLHSRRGRECHNVIKIKEAAASFSEENCFIKTIIFFWEKYSHFSHAVCKECNKNNTFFGDSPLWIFLEEYWKFPSKSVSAMSPNVLFRAENSLSWHSVKL